MKLHLQITNAFSFYTFSGLLKHYNPSHPDYHSTNMALVKMQSIIGKMSVRLRETVSSFKILIHVRKKIQLCQFNKSSCLNPTLKISLVGKILVST